MKALSRVVSVFLAAMLLCLPACGGGGDEEEQAAASESSAAGDLKSPADLVTYVASCEELAPCLRTLRDKVEGVSACAAENFGAFWLDCRTPCFFQYFLFGAFDFVNDEDSKQEMGEGYLECLAICVDEYFINRCK